MISTNRKKLIADIIFALSFFAVLWLIIRKAPMGYQFSDEPFYLTVPKRLLQGDALLADEWNLAQLSGLLLYPILRIYLMFKPTFEGIVLNFRYIFVFFHSLNAVLVYLALRRDKAAGALFAAILYLLFAYLNVMALSYNTMALGLVTVMCLLLYRCEGSFSLILAGVLMALAVLCYPYFAVFYLLYFVLVLINKRENTLNLRCRSEIFSGKSFLLASCGIALTAAVFVLFLLSRCNLQKLFAAIPLILSDTEHGNKLSLLILSFFKGLYLEDRIMGLGFGILTLIILISLFDKKRLSHRCAYIIPAAAVFAPLSLYIYSRGRNGDINLMPILITFVGTLCYILSEKRNNRLFALVFVPGIALGISGYIGSNQGLYAFGSGIGPSAIAGCIFIAECISSCVEEKSFFTRLAALALALVLLCQCGVLTLFRKNRCYWESGGPTLLCYEIPSGCAKGQKTVEYTVYEHEKTLEDTEAVRNYEGEYVLYFSFDSWLYLEDSKKNGSFSAWISAVNPVKDAERLSLYWELNPQRKPDAIFVSKSFDEAERILSLVNTEKFTVTENDSGYVMLRGE